MTGIPSYNFPAFREAARVWRSFGWDVLDPSEKYGGRTDLPYEVYIKSSILDVLCCDAVATLGGWRQSQGATLEVRIARALRLPIYRAVRPFRGGS